MKSSNKVVREAVHESSYLPFVFDGTPDTEAGPSTSKVMTSGRRVFGNVKASPAPKKVETPKQEVRRYDGI